MWACREIKDRGPDLKLGGPREKEDLGFAKLRFDSSWNRCVPLFLISFSI